MAEKTQQQLDEQQARLNQDQAARATEAQMRTDEAGRRLAYENDPKLDLYAHIIHDNHHECDVQTVDGCRRLASLLLSGGAATTDGYGNPVAPAFTQAKASRARSILSGSGMNAADVANLSDADAIERSLSVPTPRHPHDARRVLIRDGMTPAEAEALGDDDAIAQAGSTTLAGSGVLGDQRASLSASEAKRRAG